MTDDQGVRDLLLTASDHLHISPSLLVDVRRAVRRRRRRRIGYAATVLTLTALLASFVGATLHRPPPPASPDPAPPSLPSTCTADLLPLPDTETVSILTGGDHSGRFLLGSGDGVNQSAPSLLVWTDGQPDVIDIPGRNTSLADVNSSGVVIANSVDSDDVKRAWIYRDGELSPLVVEGGGGATAIAISDNGTVVGTREMPGGSATGVVWPAGSGPARNLSIEPGTGTPVDIDGDGTILGLYYYPATGTEPRIWMPTGTSAPLPPLMYKGKPAGLVPLSIYNGMIVGMADTHRPLETGVEVPVTVNVHTGAVAFASTEVYSGVTNSLGWRAGRVADGLALASSTSLTRLPALDAPAGPTDATVVLTISEDGRALAGQRVEGATGSRAVVWHCR